MKRNVIAISLVVLSLVLSLSVLVSAQEVASLTGVVTDKTGAVVPDTSVKLVDTKTNTTYEAKTNSVGAYFFSKVLPGAAYKLIFTHNGFTTFQVSNIYLTVSNTYTQNAQLEVGAASETVEVNVENAGVSLNTTDTSIGNTFDSRSIHGLPIEARESPLALLDLLPGVVDTNSTNDSNGTRQGAVTGARSDQDNITLDGLDINDFSTGQAFVAVGDAPVDSIQEFSAQTANPLSSTGRGSGAQAQMVTKSGSNSWHGSAYDYLRNTVTEANTFFNNRNGLDKPKLIRNSFGANLGGPVLKDKLFFFFNYQGRRDSSEDSVLRIVPLDSFRNGNVSYINNGAGCDSSSRADTQPSCISTVSNTGLQALDPAGIGVDTSLLDFVNSRYPNANDLTAGDGVNTGGFRFNSPDTRAINDYVGRVDYNLNNKMKLFGRFTVLRDLSGDDQNFQAPVQFLGDPITNVIQDHSWAFVVGHTWTISPNKVNQFYFGETRSRLSFPNLDFPTSPNYFQGFGSIDAPYSNPDAQYRVDPVPVFRDDFTYQKGNHNFQVGGTFKPVKTHSQQIFDYNLITLGIGGNLPSLDPSQRPSDINGDPISTNIWDSNFAFALGRFADISTNVNYEGSLQPLPSGSGHVRDYRYYETEIYLQDNWRMRKNLTVTYGLRWQYYSVPYEMHGAESVPSLGFDDVFNGRIALGQQGLLGPQPITTYSLGGKANNAPGFYHPNWRDFAPRVSFSYNPSSSGDGFFGKLLGDRKTVIRAGAGIIFDHPTTNALNFVQDQASYLFQTNVSSRPAGDLATDPRFVSTTGSLPLNPVPPVVAPVAPFVDEDGPFGAAEGQSNYAIDPHLKTPYSITYTAGIQRELPGNFLMEVNYFARLGRRLLAQTDAAQVVDFKDTASGHFLVGDFADLTKQVRTILADPTGDPASATPEPFFENQVFPGATSLIAGALTSLVSNGDLGDLVQFLAGQGLLAPGIGLPPQFATDAYITNKSFSAYNGMLVSLHKRFSHNVQFDTNYTYSHSIDNVSATANNIFGTGNFTGGLICDVTNIRECRGNSDFDIRHIVTVNGIWDIPVGRGMRFGSDMPNALNQVIGGWKLSGTFIWHSGFAFTTNSNAFPFSFSNNTPAIFDGDQHAIASKIHTDPSSGAVQFFADQDAALGAFRGPIGQEAGQRNSLYGPNYSNFNLGLSKLFPIRDKYTIEFRADAFNAFNHTNFNLPGNPGSLGTSDITDPSQFGVITSAAASRQMQFALRLDF